MGKLKKKKNIVQLISVFNISIFHDSKKKVKINIIEDVVDEFFVSLRYPVECPLQTFEDWDYFFPQDDLELPLSLNVHASHRFNGFVIVLILDTLLDWLVPISPAYSY